MSLSEVAPANPEPLQQNFTRQEASDYLWDNHRIPRSPGYLAVQAVKGGGPPFHRVGRNVIYTRSDLDAYADDLRSPAATTTAEHDHLSAA